MASAPKRIAGIIAATLLAGMAAGTEAAQDLPTEVRCVTEVYPPYAAPDLPGQGRTWTLVERAFATRGVHARLEFRTWARALEEAKSGRYDCLVAAFRTPERDASFLFSKPLDEVRTGFFRRRDRADIHYDGTLESLRGWRIGVGRGYVNGAAFDRATFLTKVELESSEQGLRMLHAGRLDLLAGVESVDEYTLRHALESKEPGISEDIVFIRPPLQVQPLHVAFPRQNPASARLARALDAGVRALKKSGEWKRLMSDYDAR